MTRCRFLKWIGSGCGQQLLPKLPGKVRLWAVLSLLMPIRAVISVLWRLWREWGVGCSACVRCGVEGDSG